MSTAVAVSETLRIDVDPRILAVIRDPAAPEALLPEQVTPPKDIPGALGPFANLAHILGLARYGAAHSAWLNRRYGDIYRLGYGRDEMVFVWELEQAQKILRNEDSAWSTGMGWDSFLFGRLEPHGGNSGSLVSMDFEPHRAARRMVQPAFTNKAVKGYVDIAQPLIERAVSAWLARGRVGFKAASRALLSDVANAIFTGVADERERAKLDRALREVWAASLTLLDRAWLSPDLRRGRRQWHALNEYFGALLRERAARPGPDMFSQLALAREGGSDVTFVKGFVAIMLAAYDTTSAAVTSMIYLLAKHQDWQARLRDELRATQPLDLPSLQKLPQLDWVWKESLRLMPVTGFVPRRALREVEVSGHRLPAGCMVGVYVGATGRSASYWSDPDQFDPARFSPARAEDKRRPGLYAPFGSGAHACVGMQLAGIEAKLLLQQLLTRCRFALQKDYDARHTYTPIGIVSGAVELKLEAL
jgi:cytochrome P450